MKQGYKEIKINKKDSVRDADDLAVDIGTNMTRARLKAGLTQVELAKKMKTLQPSIARVESGSKVPSNHFLLRVAKVLKTHLIAPTFESIEEENLSARISCRNCIKTTEIKPLTFNVVVQQVAWTDSGFASHDYLPMSRKQEHSGVNTVNTCYA